MALFQHQPQAISNSPPAFQSSNSIYLSYQMQQRQSFLSSQLVDDEIYNNWMLHPNQTLTLTEENQSQQNSPEIIGRVNFDMTTPDCSPLEVFSPTFQKPQLIQFNTQVRTVELPSDIFTNQIQNFIYEQQRQIAYLSKSISATKCFKPTNLIQFERAIFFSQ